MEEPVNMVESVESVQDSLSPFISIWFRPRGTIRRIVDTEPEKHVLLLAVISGIIRGLDNASDRGMGNDFSLPFLLALSVIFGGLGGIITLYVGGALFRWSGSWFGGTADSREVRAALAWSNVPGILVLGLYVLIIVLYGRNWFTSSEAWMEGLGLLSVVLIIGVSFLAGILGIWSLFLLVKCLAEVHRFSAWRSLAAILSTVVPLAVLAATPYFWDLWKGGEVNIPVLPVALLLVVGVGVMGFRLGRSQFLDGWVWKGWLLGVLLLPVLVTVFDTTLAYAIQFLAILYLVIVGLPFLVVIGGWRKMTAAQIFFDIFDAFSFYICVF